MGMDYSIYTEFIEPGLKSDKQKERFYINFVLDGKRKREQLDYSNDNLGKKQRVIKAKKFLLDLKEKIANSSSNINTNSTLNQIAEMYFNSRDKTKWTNTLKNVYRIHIQKPLGNKKVTTIKKVHIDQLKASLELKGASKQTANGCSPRTIQKVLVQTLKPILQYAVDNDLIYKIPSITLSKAVRTKKYVDKPQEALHKLYEAINETQKDSPFYYSLFMFAFYGRRQNEIFTLEWKDIDLQQALYKIRKENNKVNRDQVFSLPEELQKSLPLIEGKHEGLVFKSYVTGKQLTAVRAPLKKIKEHSEIKELSMHYFRHCLSSYAATLGGVSALEVSAMLGNTSTQTTQQYYITQDNLIASTRMNELIGSKLITLEAKDKIDN